MARETERLLDQLSMLRRYRKERAARLPFRIRLPYIRNRIRHRALDSWPGGYIFNDSGDIVYVPKPVELMGGYRLMKSYVPSPLVRAICKTNDVVVDVGANIGEWTLAVARAVGGGGRVLAFEPVPHVADALRKTISANRLSHVEIFELALAEANGTRGFSVERENTGGSRLDVMSDDARRTFDSITVKTARFDDVLSTDQLTRLDLMKIDVEGFELAVLDGAQDAIRRFRPAILMETGHETAERRCGIAEMLSGYGYRIVGLLVGEGMLEGSWDDYRARQGVFRDFGVTDMLLMP